MREPRGNVTGTDGGEGSIQAALPRAEASASRGLRVRHAFRFFLLL